MENKKGFTLVELLAVIAILAILVIIALPNIINMYNRAQKETFLTETKKIYSEAEKKYISSSITGNAIKIINSEDDSKLDMTGEKLQYCVILNNRGKVKSLKVSNGKWVASLDNNKNIEDLTIDNLENGNLNNYKCSEKTSNVPLPIYCTFDGEMVAGAEYVNGQYTYRYKQRGVYSITDTLRWSTLGTDGWGVQLTDKTSTDPITSKVCAYINDKPVVFSNYMYAKSQSPSIDLTSFDTSNVTNMIGMFQESKALTIDGLEKFNTSKVTDMSDMFYLSKTKVINVENFDTSNVTNMSRMFANSSVTSIIGLKNFDTSSVRNMYALFLNVKSETLDVSNFDTSNVTNMDKMFYGTTAVLSLNNFDTSKVEYMGGMFGLIKYDNLDLSSFNTSNVIDMNEMFYGTNINKLNLSNFDTSKVTDMSDMFEDATIPELDLKNFDTSNVTDMSFMFRNTKINNLNLSSFNTSNVTTMYYMFEGSKVSSLDISNFNTSKVTDMRAMFSSTAFDSIDLSNFDTRNVTKMDRMFWLSSVSSLDLSSFNTLNVTDMSHMFSNCKNLEKIYVSDKFVNDNVTSSIEMFYRSFKLVGGNGTEFNSSYIDKTYARIDTSSTPGYFTLKTN